MQDYDKEVIEYLQNIIANHADFDNCKNLLENLNASPFSSREYTNILVYFLISIFSEGMVDENNSIDIIREESLRFL